MSAAAFAVAVLALLFSGYAVVAGERRARRSERQREALGPAPAELREALERLRAAFQEIVIHGGQDRAFFLDEERKLIGQSLSDNAARVGNAQLRSALALVAGTWTEAFAISPQHDYVINLNDVSDPERNRRLAAVDDLAHRGLDECADALGQINSLEAGT